MNEVHDNAVDVVTKKFTTHDAEYKALLAHMKETLMKRIEADGRSLFRTKTLLKGEHEIYQEHGWSLELHERHPGFGFNVNLNRVYLSSLTDEVQYHTCSCCSSFLKRFGGLVTIDEQGETHSAVWDASTFPEDNFYYPFVKNIQAAVERGRVIGAHRSSKTVWGDFVMGGFEHFALHVPGGLIYEEFDLSCRQKQAALKQDYEAMAKHLSTTPMFSIDNLKKLMQVLNSEALKGAEKIQGAGRWLYKLATERAEAPNSRVKENLLWRAIGAAPAGWANSKNNVIGTVLEDLQKGTPFKDMAAKYGRKTAVDVYQQSVAAPTEGAIDAAEKLFEKQGLAPSLRRRVATLDDLPPQAFIWRDSPQEEQAKPARGGIFGGLKAKLKGTDREELKLPPVTMSWNKFSSEILPEVTSADIYIPAQTDIFSGLTTAVVPDAPPILMYDDPENRNTVTSYAVFSGKDERSGALIGLPPANWNLEMAKYHPLQAMVTGPHEWGNIPMPQFRNQVYFVIEGAYDKSLEAGKTGLMIFPVLLRSELHSVKRVIEAFSKDGKLEGSPTQQVAGLSISQGNAVPRRLRVQTQMGMREIIIDRWE